MFAPACCCRRAWPVCCGVSGIRCTIRPQHLLLHAVYQLTSLLCYGVVSIACGSARQLRHDQTIHPQSLTLRLHKSAVPHIL